MAHASRWLAGRELGTGELTLVRVDAFLADRRAEGYTFWLSTKAVVPILEYLRGLGVVPTPSPVGPSTPVDELVAHYRSYLVQERGLAVSTVISHVHVARLFFSARSRDGELDLERLSAAEVTDFVLSGCTARNVGSAKY